MKGDADIASIGALVADPGRARILLALGDGRALPASVLADEAGVAASTASAHLGKLVKGGMLRVERHGRHRYFRLAGPEVGELIEALARISPPAPVRSLKQGNKAQAVRFARTCYDHLAGMLGTQLMEALLEQELLTGGDGVFDPDAAREDRLCVSWLRPRLPPDAGRAARAQGLRDRLRLAAGAPAADPVLRGLERAASSPRRVAGRGARDADDRARLGAQGAAQPGGPRQRQRATTASASISGSS